MKPQMHLGGPPEGPPPKDLRGPPPILKTIFIRRSKPRVNRPVSADLSTLSNVVEEDVDDSDDEEEDEDMADEEA